MTREEIERDLAEMLEDDPPPLEGSQWPDPSQWPEHLRRRAGIKPPSPDAGASLPVEIREMVREMGRHNSSISS